MFSPADDELEGVQDADDRRSTTPESTNSRSLIRLTRMPAWNAASWLSPMAYSERPNGVMRSTTPAITATTRKSADRPREPRDTRGSR